MINPDELTMEFTGERMVPEYADIKTFWEHIYRYKFASRYVTNKRVLDIACGEGYGSAALLQAGAKHVIGVDISEETCQHANRKYGVDARVGNAEQIPLAESSIDVIVSFETIEHVMNPQTFINECNRVLVPGGKFIVSTPNKGVYHYGGEGPNPYHCSEMSKDEFETLLKQNFANYQLYSQQILLASWWRTRSLAAQHSIWKRTRGLRRLHKIAANLWYRPHFEETSEKRKLTTQEVLKKDSIFTSLFNPYQLRKVRNIGYEKPEYFIAVATIK